MPRVQYGTSSYARGRGGLPDLPVVNMYVEEAPTEDDGAMLLSRPGLRSLGPLGSGPIKAIFQRDGVVSGDAIIVSGTAIYRNGTNLGALAGTGPVSVAGNEIGVVVAAGSTARYYDGTTLANISFPDSANVLKVIEGASRFIFIRSGTGKFYWTEPLSATVDALAFATAESAADGLLDALFINDMLMLFGAETVEPWPNVEDPDLPFKPLEAAVIEKGIKATGCATALGSTFAWVTNENTVCIQDENNIVSNKGLQKRIGESASCSLFTFLIDGQEFLALRIDNETQMYNPRTGFWSELKSFGFDNWLPQCYAAGTFGSSVDGKLLAWGDTYDDLDGEHERLFRAGFPINGEGVDIDVVSLRAQVGQTPFLETPITEDDSPSLTDFSNPRIQMSLSPDGGLTWDDPFLGNVGTQGDYRRRIEFRACGLASHPGFLAEFRVTAPIDFRVSGVFVNEQSGGR